MLFISNALADTGAVAAAQPPLSSLMMPLGLMALVLYFLIFRPQQKKMKEHETLLAGIKKGEEVVSQSGIFGKVFEVNDATVTLEIANNVRIKMLKSHIATVVRNEPKA